MSFFQFPGLYDSVVLFSSTWPKVVTQQLSAAIAGDEETGQSVLPSRARFRHLIRPAQSSVGIFRLPGGTKVCVVRGWSTTVHLQYRWSQHCLQFRTYRTPSGGWSDFDRGYCMIFSERNPVESDYFRFCGPPPLHRHLTTKLCQELCAS